MTQNVFFENLKKFRLAKNLTQEQAAEQLCVNAQTVSRWECGTTLPDARHHCGQFRIYGSNIIEFCDYWLKRIFQNAVILTLNQSITPFVKDCVVNLFF